MKPKVRQALDAETAAKVLLADLSNVLRKVKSGKPLTKYERGLLEAHTESKPAAAPAAGETEWVRSYAALGAVVGLHRASFPRLRKDYPDAPRARANGDHSVAAWRKFLEAHPQIQCKSGGERRGKSELELAILEEKLRTAKRDNDISDRLYILRSEVDAWLTGRCERIKEILRTKLKHELPPKLEGLRAEEIAGKMDEVIEGIVTVLRTK